MTEAESPSSPAALQRHFGPNHRTVLRWHFYASLFCIPFVVILAVSGSIYLFKPQVEAWNERVYDNLTVAGSPAPAARIVEAALKVVPDSQFSSYQLPHRPTSATQVVVSQLGETIRVYVHPETGAVLGQIPERDRFMKVIHRLHGELLLGEWGSLLVELAASWTVIMILTGLFLWWPRGSSRWAGVIYPRLTSSQRIFWRDLHGVTGFWISAFALTLILSGLPWSKSWGNYLKAVRQLTGTAVAKQDWSTGGEGKQRNNAPKIPDEPAADEHAGHNHGTATSETPANKTASANAPGKRMNRGDRRPKEAVTPKDLTAIDRVAAVVGPLQLEYPVVIAATGTTAINWTAKSMTANRPWRVNLVVNSETGAIVSRENFSDRHWVDQIVGVGIALHEGQLFGWPNQLLGLFTAGGLVLLSSSGIIMWLRRRKAGTLGAPKPSQMSQTLWPVLVLAAALGLYLPLFGTSLIGVVLIDQILLRRISRIRAWLG